MHHPSSDFYSVSVNIFRAWVKKVKDKRLKKPKLNSVKDDDGYHADKSESEEAEQSSSDYCPSEDSFVSTGLTGLLVLRDQPQRKRLVSQDDLHSERCIEPALRLSTGQSSQTGSLDLLANADIVYSQSQPEDRVNEDDNSEQNGETASRADDDQNSVESNDEENFTESDQSKTSIKSNDEENFTARYRSKTWMKSDDEENFTARDQSKTWMKSDDEENFTVRDQSKTWMKSDDVENFTESDQSKTSMKSDDEGNFTESNQRKTSMESDDEENFTENDQNVDGK
ncbi:RNA polymerase-associated protein LEO1-like [Dendronephthya gigantea]|uniref:RNA polymerase-associated protein LEO1-like n=1 Tax=Dendronephthya gigantea TaxID=151771 RepID=UPI00106A2E46|nr:RNA polymerase-associated protein LEO1-like [Dendronephthya gigantea]